jgi:DUF3102 family protein
LIDAKALAGHGGWLPWLEREFGWTDQTARRFMQVAEASKSNNLLNLSVDVSIAAPSTPPEVIEAVAERCEQGDRVSLDEVKQMIAEAQERTDMGSFWVLWIFAHLKVGDPDHWIKSPNHFGSQKECIAYIDAMNSVGPTRLDFACLQDGVELNGTPQ